MKGQRILLLPILALALLISACAAPASVATATPREPTAEVVPATEVPLATTELVVMAASSLTDAFNELADAFELANPNVEVLPNYASSSSLATQIVEGAPADVFASANFTQMNVAVDAQRIEGEPAAFLTNRLTIIVPSDNPAGLETYTDLGNEGVALVLAAPDVPVRDYSNQAIALMGNAAWQAAVFANLVSEEPNVRQVATKVSLGEADAGIVYTSDVTPDIASSVLQITIPDEMNVIASYPIAVVKDAPARDVAQAFVDFVLSPEGQAILAKWGFGPRP
ncbi:MAG TPA: molybdate ABC transporter substrate-binding protein [Anaerolineales bacterium]|nr:molybdate ABC transporter substrate-binding protein [Anaerolineales bacterium]HRQ92094.1 molybdate ABC transporter substrate-binding protein [Anaerolineales bacterium]